jgi:hypothetical protein
MVSLSPRLGWGLLGFYAVGIVLALFSGSLEPLFYATSPHDAQGIDFFCVPKAFLNLWEGHSAFDTWSSPAFGPSATWFVLHPAVAVTLGGYLAWLPPWWSYGVFAALTMGIFAGVASLFARHARSPWHKVWVWGAAFASPLTLVLLYCGNIHGLVVMAVALLLSGLLELGQEEEAQSDAQSCAPGEQNSPLLSPAAKVGTGLALSLLTKPVLILLVPALLLVHRTRRATLVALTAYSGVSLLFLLLPALNPEGVGLQRIAELFFSPAWVQQHLNIYKNGFQLTPEMRDNAMHWLHMVAQSGFGWDHLQVLSLPSLWQGMTGTPMSFQWVALLPIVLSLGLRGRDEREQLRALGWLTILALASHFLAYAIAWEYQYTQFLPVLAFLLVWEPERPKSPLHRWLLVALITYYLPSPYFLYGSESVDLLGRTWIRAFRVLPALFVAGGAMVMVLRVRGPVSQPKAN